MDYTADEVRDALKPLASLIGKSEKAYLKLKPGTWQHTMLRDNLAALHHAVALMTDAAGEEDLTPGQLQGHLGALASMIRRTESAGAKFRPGTSQHTLQRNRLQALRIAAAFIRAEADGPGGGLRLQ